MIKILGLALYGHQAASTRYRLAQYANGLKEFGIDLHIRHLLGDVYLQRTFEGGSKPWRAMLKAGWKRLGDLCGQGGYDAIIVHCELFPLIPGWVERAMLRKPYIYDFDDAFYMKYRSERFRGLASLLARKFDVVMRGADAVTAGNHILADYSRRHNLNTTFLPTVVDTEHYVSAPHKRGHELRVGWIGSPSTAPYLSTLIGPLTELSKEGSVRLVVIGGDAPRIPGIVIEEHKWSETTEVKLINSFDIGVMPLPDNEWARGKCAFKLIQYLACGVPVVASPVGANIDVAQPECGLLASTDAEWLAALRQLRDQPQQAADMGLAGRALVEKNYSLRRNLPILAKVISGVADKEH